MNIHPILVHMPIGIFVIYTVMEVLFSSKKFPSLKNGKRFLAVAGFVAGWATLATGENAEHLLRNKTAGQVLDQNMHKVLEAHSTIAGAFVVVAGALALIAIVSWVIENYPTPTNTWQNIVHKLSFIDNRSFVILLAIVGLGLISVVGGLGGIIVYGPDLDPMTKLLYSLVTGF